MLWLLILRTLRASVYFITAVGEGDAYSGLEILVIRNALEGPIPRSETSPNAIIRSWTGI
jgi:hypothetical protein